jgi:hypothetical protein
MRFKSFRLEVQQVAGFHTGRTLNVNVDNLDDHAVYQHERIHGRIFTDTIDGYLGEVLSLLEKGLGCSFA